MSTLQIADEALRSRVVVGSDDEGSQDIGSAMSSAHRRPRATDAMLRCLRLAALVRVTVVIAVAVGLSIGCSDPRLEPEAEGKRVIVLGFDGMDYRLARRFMDDGRMPNLKRLAEMGHFQPLATAVPPQSPVAWSNFITGLDSGGHGIFDFMHRDPATMIPYLSTSRAAGTGRNLKLGRYQIPLARGRFELLRRGEEFWKVLEENGVQTTIIRMPANFPPSGTATFEVSGMGTPDILGTYGIFSFYTSQPFLYEGKGLSGGKVYPVAIDDGVVEGTLYGPDNPFLVGDQKVTASFTAFIDPDQPVIKLVVGDEKRVLKVGEWSDWVPISLDMVRTQSIPVEALFYLKSVNPVFELYVSPLNLDPFAPAMPISTPNSYARKLAEASGRFYTQGTPEDTNALVGGILSREEFLEQAHIAGRELIRQYETVLGNFDQGLLFYYFGNLDQISHMMFRPLDPEHPAYDAEKDAPFAHVIPDVYAELDGVVGATLERMGPNTTLIVMSDHGFASVRRQFNLNAWLRENGFLAVLDPYLEQDPGLFLNVDWSRTRAYGLGLNGLYINLRDRERNGIVSPSDRKALMDEISQELLATIDPKTGLPVVTKMYAREETYHDRGQLEIGPDLQVGYGPHVQCSGDSALGKVSGEVLADNLDEWSGNHAMDHELVPGVLFTSRPLKQPVEDLQHLAAAIIAEFGIRDFPRAQATAAQTTAVD